MLVGASGSSSCAAAAVARRLGLCNNEITVHMPGGHLEISIAADYAVTMTGPVTKVCEGMLSDEAFSSRAPDAELPTTGAVAPLEEE